jgi:ribosomal-protein-alanine N-acetyltransferase
MRSGAGCDTIGCPGRHGMGTITNQAPTLTGKRVTLRRPRDQDVEDRLKYGRHAEIVRMYGGDSRDMKPLTREEAVVQYQRDLSTPLAWAIEQEGECVGIARLTVNEADQRARFAIGISDIDRLGKGLGTEATQLVLGYAFNSLRLHRVDLRVLEYNRRAIRCFEKCGFVREGVEREGALVEGQWETDVMMSILAQEYRPQPTRDPRITE